MLSKKCKILVTIVLSLALALCISVPCISYCSADFDDEDDYQLNISSIVGTTNEQYYNSIYSSRVGNPSFGESLLISQGSLSTNILYQYDSRVNNIITFTSSNGGIQGIELIFSDFVYNFNDSTSIFGSVYCENATFATLSYYVYDINLGYFDFVVFDNLVSNNGWYALDYSLPQNFRNNDGYTYVIYMSVYFYFNTSVSSRTIEFDILPNYSYTITNFFNSLKTVERIEYDLNFFESLAQSVDRIMLIEIFPGISFYSLLSVVIAVPIFIAILKLWLGG